MCQSSEEIKTCHTKKANISYRKILHNRIFNCKNLLSISYFNLLFQTENFDNSFIGKKKRTFEINVHVLDISINIVKIGLTCLKCYILFSPGTIL